MPYVIDLGAELLVDRTRVSLPQLLLLLCAIGRPLVQGSPWIVVEKESAAAYNPMLALLSPHRGRALAAQAVSTRPIGPSPDVPRGDL